MKSIKLNELKSHDVYEFCYAENYPNHWNENSIFFDSDDFINLQPFLNKLFYNYHYYGPQKIKLSQWEKIKILIQDNNFSNYEEKLYFKKFIETVETWLYKNKKHDYFWILGI